MTREIVQDDDELDKAVESSDLESRLRAAMQEAVEKLMESAVTELLGAGPWERSEERRGYRNVHQLLPGGLGDDDVAPHRLARRSARTSAAGRTRPVRAASRPRAIDASSAARSASSMSSPSSSTTRSSTVPSGRSVGSSTRRRPLCTRARSPCMAGC